MWSGRVRRRMRAGWRGGMALMWRWMMVVELTQRRILGKPGVSMRFDSRSDGLVGNLECAKLRRLIPLRLNRIDVTSCGHPPCLHEPCKIADSPEMMNTLANLGSAETIKQSSSKTAPRMNETDSSHACTELRQAPSVSSVFTARRRQPRPSITDATRKRKTTMITAAAPSFDTMILRYMNLDDVTAAARHLTCYDGLE